MRSLIPCFSLIKRPIIPDSARASLNPNDQNRPFLSSTPIFRTFNTLFDYNINDTQSICSEPECEPDFAAVFASQRFFFTSPGRSNSIIESCPSISTMRENTGLSPLVSPSESDHNSDNSQAIDSVDEPPGDGDSVAVDKYSPDPYADFRRSMQDMVAARGLHDAKANWEKLHELLLCYLALNPKNTHGFIVRAFSDLLVTLMSAPETVCA